MMQLRYSDLCQMLRDQVDLVIDRFCSIEGAYKDRQGRHFCLNPMRPDRSVGSFWIETRGPKIGRWQDKATGGYGDAMDMVRELHNIQSGKEGDRQACKIAAAILGVGDLSPKAQQDYQRQVELRRRQREAAELQAQADKAKASGRAQHLFLRANQDVRGTPVDRYLQGRGIFCDQLGRFPRALRYLPDCYYQHIDNDTGEIIEQRMPAMVGAITGEEGQFLGLHRTYLAQDEAGIWRKAPVPDPKKVYASHLGGLIRIWSGIGPRGGKAAPLAQCPEGSRVYVTEGIEDALSLVSFAPQYRVVAAISLGNLGKIWLPETVTEVVLCSDNDDGEEARETFERAAQSHQMAGRDVRIWRNQWGGKDLNDALMAYRAGERRDVG